MRSQKQTEKKWIFRETKIYKEKKIIINITREIKRYIYKRQAYMTFKK